MNKWISVASILLFSSVCSFAAKADAVNFDYRTLFDHNGSPIQQWGAINNPYSAHLTDSGTVFYTAGGGGMGFNTCSAGAEWGNIIEVDWHGNVIRTITASQLGGGSPHHSITLTSRGTILAFIGENYNGECGERLVEYDVAQNKVIWAWHTNDHQGNGATKLQRNPTNRNDPYHMNAADWDPTSNRIVFSAHNTFEVYIINRSIDSNTAKTSAGDILWRIGNPSRYGASGSQYIDYAVHSARWVKTGQTGAGNIMFYANLSPANNGYSTGYVFRPIYQLKQSGEWDYELIFKANNYYNSESYQGGMDQLYNGNWLVTFKNTNMAYEFDPALGASQTIDMAVGQWNSVQQNGLRRYPLCYGAIRAGMLKGDAEATAHYNAHCNSGVSSSVLTSSSSAVVSVKNILHLTDVQLKVHQGLLSVSGLRHNAWITVMDLNGQIVYRSLCKADHHVIHSNKWPKGIYLVQIQAGIASLNSSVFVGHH